MACGGESGMDACRAEEHAPVGTTLCPKHAQRPPAWIFTSLNWEKNLFLMCAASKNDAPRHFLSDSKALNGNGIFPESTSLSSQTDKSCRKVPQLDAQNQSGEYRGVQLRFGAQIGRAHVCTPVTNAKLVCRLLLETKKQQYQ